MAMIDQGLAATSSIECRDGGDAGSQHVMAGLPGAAMLSAAAAAATASFALPIDIEALQAIAPWSLVVVDANALIVAASTRARDLLRAGGGIEERAGRLHVERASINRKLRDRIAAVLGHGPANPARGAGARESGPDSALVGAPDRRGRTRYVVKVSPLPCSGSGLATVAISDLNEQGRVDRREVATLFGLSDREAELAEHFSHGLKIDEIAEAMGVATNTVRVHLRHVFSKTGCNSQVELARLFVLVP